MRPTTILLAAAGLMAACAGPQQPPAAEPDTAATAEEPVFSGDFEDGATGAWSEAVTDEAAPPPADGEEPE